MGVRQLRDAIPRLPVAGRGEDGVRAHRGRSARPPTDGLLPVGRVAHPLGRGRGLRVAETLRRRGGRQAGRDQPEPVRVRRVPARQPLQPGRRRSRAGARALPRVRRDRARGRLDHPEPLARRRHQLPGPGRPRVEIRATGRGAGTALRRAPRRDDVSSSSTSSSNLASTAPIFRTGGPRRSSADVSAPVRRCWSTPDITRSGRTSSRSSRCCSRKGSWAASTSTTGSTPTTT